MKQDMVLKDPDFVIHSGLYVLKHKDMDVAMIQVDTVTGKIEYILDVYLSEELGNLLTDFGKIDMETNISKFSPASSVSGEMKKKWVIKDNTRYLMKVSINDYGQQSVNEVIASALHERLGWKNYVHYQIDKVLVDGKEYPCSLNPLFTSLDLEFVSAHQLVRDYKAPNSISDYEAVICQAERYGLDGEIVRKQLEYTIMTDFILSNTDRHFNNFGFLYLPEEHRLAAMAPIFDTGNALFYNKEIIPFNSLLEIPVSSFCRREADLLRYVRHSDAVNLSMLEDFPEEAENLLKEYTDMPKERAEAIALTIEKKIEYLKLFQSGKRIWKTEKYW